MKRQITLLLAALVLILAACGSDDETTEAADGDTDNSSEQTDSETDSGETDSDDESSDQEPATGTELPADTVVFIWSETGGCAMAGPNCARYEITADGSVSSFREGEAEAEVTGAVDAAAVQDWIKVVADTDLDTMVAGLGPGEMTAAFDGTDFTLEAPHANLLLSSIEVGFESTEPLFKQAEQLAQLAAGEAPLPLQGR